jgi:hypothetical protein
MTIQDDEGFDGIEFDTPVGSFRAGRGARSPQEEAYRQARARVRRRMGFYRHLSTAITVLALLFVIDVITNAGEFWVHWVALIWGAVLLVHLLNVWVFDSLLGGDAERRMVEEELRKRKGRGS